MREKKDEKKNKYTETENVVLTQLFLINISNLGLYLLLKKGFIWNYPLG